MWTGRRVVLGVSGGIACYKSCTLARRLTEAGAQVAAILDAEARRVARQEGLGPFVDRLRREVLAAASRIAAD